MPDPIILARATVGQLRRAGFAVEPADADDSVTTGYEVLCNHTDPSSAAEHEKAKGRGDHMPKGKQ